MDSSAARTNLTSQHVTIHTNRLVGEGHFRYAFAGTYIGGNRNTQEAICKRFKPQYVGLEQEFYRTDFKVASKAVQFAEDWNAICPVGKDILITYGSLKHASGFTYLVEPLIRYFEKFTSNNGWIADENDVGWAVLAMEAFSHYTYHKSGGQMIVCDIQGRYKHNR